MMIEAGCDVNEQFYPKKLGYRLLYMIGTFAAELVNFFLFGEYNVTLAPPEEKISSKPDGPKPQHLMNSATKAQ